ncbi:MAG: hypothetical protein LBF34_01850 [Puniceicoccales bacterium]|jgi:hypothetical protein|nr:hypothetical protein [Puniceicoccales bacterium]
MSSIKLSAQKIKDVSNLKIIAAAWSKCADKGVGTYITSFADQLCLYANLNDAYVYISPGDKYAIKLARGAVSAGAFNNWAQVNNFMIVSDVITSYCFVTGLLDGAPPGTTPLGFTRGLNKNGKWDEKAGLYGSKGGYVVFCDGHTTWFDGNKPAKFLKWDQSGYTSDIREALPTGVPITCVNRQNLCLQAPYKGENAQAILYAVGTGGD